MDSHRPIATTAAEEGRTRAPRSRRAWLGRVVRSGAFALLLVTLSATAAAASDPIGSLGDGANAPLVEPLSPAAEPVVELAGGTVGPILDPITPDAPVLPAVPITPLLPVSPPVLPLPPILDAPADLPIPGLSASASVPLTTSAPPAAAVRGPDPILDRSPIDIVASSVTTVAGEVAQAGAAVRHAVVQSVGAAVGGLGLTTDVSTSVMAGMLIGLSMAIAAGWSVHPGQVRLRPIGLLLAPPVPPG